DALAEVLQRGSVPAPDSFIRGDITVSETGLLNLVYGDTASVECILNDDGNEVYRVTATSNDGSYGFELLLDPKKAPVNHGQDGIVHGHKMDSDDMYYCFVSRCDVSGSIRVDNVDLVVDGTPGASTGWYDREMGGSIHRWYQPSTKSTEGSWIWGSAQLSNGWDLTFYTVWDVNIYDGKKEVRDRTAIAISPEGERIECTEHMFECKSSWTSTDTLNEYERANQETRTICAVRGYWEGRVKVNGAMFGQATSGLGFVENVPAQLVTKFSQYLKRMGSLTMGEVRKVYPERLTDPLHAADILGLDQTTQRLVDRSSQPDCFPSTRFTEDLPLDVLHHHLFAPVRHITERGGKSWRS
ncbi:hypothetical protein MPER_08730, partial [Moniliophthora perniciosa FA553]